MRAKSIQLVVLGSLLTACAVAPDDTGRMEQPFSTTPVEPAHEEITGAALDFLRPEIVLALQAANVATDVQFVLDATHHFDNCNFSGSSNRVREDQADALAALDPSAPSPESDARAIVSFGRSLHTVQDFYAHTNWVELGEEGLVDTSLGAWPVLSPYALVGAEPSGVVLVQGTPPRGVSLFRKVGAKYPRNAVVTVREGKTTRDGLISGTVDYEPGNFCPPQIAMTHDELNKDRSTTHPPQHEAAKSLAIAQTRHEWCRLLTMARETYGDAGDRRLFSWVSDPEAASQCGAPVDLTVSMTRDDQSINVTYDNQSATTAYGTRLVVTMPSDWSATADGCDVSPGVVDCYLGAVSTSGSLSIAIVEGSAGAVRAEISAHAVDSDPSNNTVE